MLKDVATGRVKARHAAKSAPKSKKAQTQSKSKPKKTFDQKVWDRWLAWLKKFEVSEVRQVKALVRGFIEGKKPASA
jgi:hypothetical protein